MEFRELVNDNLYFYGSKTINDKEYSYNHYCYFKNNLVLYDKYNITINIYDKEKRKIYNINFNTLNLDYFFCFKELDEKYLTFYVSKLYISRFDPNYNYNYLKLIIYDYVNNKIVKKEKTDILRVIYAIDRKDVYMIKNGINPSYILYKNNNIILTTSFELLVYNDIKLNINILRLVKLYNNKFILDNWSVKNNYLFPHKTKKLVFEIICIKEKLNLNFDLVYKIFHYLFDL